jgi:hypothetical protein
MRGISRIDSGHSHAWMVRLYHDGQVDTKTFSDGRYGGKAQALDAALAYHKAEQRRLHILPPPLIRPPFRMGSSLLRNNKTGVNGVSETYHRWRTGEKVACFSVNYRLGGVIYNRRFYHHQYDSREAALKAAAAFRREMEREMKKEWKVRLRRYEERKRSKGG